MDKFFEEKIKGANDPITSEGIDDYYDEKKEDEYFVNKDTKFEETNSSLLQILDRLNSINKTSKDYKINQNYDYYLRMEFKRIIKKRLSENDFVGIINLGKDALREFSDMKDVEKLDTGNAGDAILITEAINLSAKISTELFYMLKPAMIVACANIGAKIGIENDNGWNVYYLFDQNVGVASFHDPGGEVYPLLRIIDDEIKIKEWEFGWSGITRQDLAYNLISKKEQLFLQKMRYKTLPGVNATKKKELFARINKRYSI